MKQACGRRVTGIRQRCRAGFARARQRKFGGQAGRAKIALPVGRGSTVVATPTMKMRAKPINHHQYKMNRHILHRNMAHADLA